MADRSDRDYQRDYYGSGPTQSGERHGQGGGRYRNEPRHEHDRGFFERAGEHVKSWFGDEAAERHRIEERDRSYREPGRNETRAYASGERGYGQRDWDRTRESGGDHT